MTGVIFQQWLQSFILTMKMRKRNVLLLDNAGSHTEPPTLSNVTVRFLPANTTAHLQPMDGGIIENFKVHYRCYLGLHFVNCIDNKEQPKVDLRQAIGMIADSWKDVKQGTVANCWKHVGILQFGEDQYDTTDLNPEDIRPLLSNIEAMTHRLEVDPSKRMAAEDYVNIDNKAETEEALTDDPIIELVSGEPKVHIDEEQDADDLPPPPPPTVADAHKACRLLIAFYESEVAKDDSHGSKLIEIRKHMKHIEMKRIPEAKQTSITDFFHSFY